MPSDAAQKIADHNARAHAANAQPDDPAVAARIAADALLRETTAERDALRADKVRLDWIERESVDVRACYVDYRVYPAKGRAPSGVPGFRVFTESSGPAKARAIRDAIDKAMRAAEARAALGARRGEG